jgi:phosphonate dehydrogenase
VKIVVTQPIHGEVRDLLAGSGEVTIGHIENAFDAEALMVFMPDLMDEEFLEQCSRLKVVAAALKGFDNFDVEACTRRGVWFTIVPDLLTEPTAELALALMLGLARNVAAGDALIRSGKFEGWRPVLYGSGLAGATVGIIGYGRVGQALARMLGGFGCRVLHHDIDSGVQLSELLAASDFVLPLLPLTPETLHLISRTTLAQMKPGAFLINVSRGSVVDEAAVADALVGGHLAGYAADVFEMEDWARVDRPREISPRLLRLTDKTLFTPHLGSAVARVRLEIERTAALNIIDVLSGRNPRNAVNRIEPR